MSAQKTFGHSILIAALCLFNFAAAAFAQEGAPAQPILILEARANSDNTLTITGRNFGTGSPIVDLDGSLLTVSSNSDTQIIAQLPAALPLGLHMLAVRSGPESTEFGLFNLWIGPVETDAPQDTPEPAELRTAGLKEYSLGHFVEAQRLLDRAMALALERSDTYLVALIHDGLGGIYQDEFEFTKADHEFMNAVDILRQQPGHSHALAMTLANLGAALCGERRYGEASTFLSEASKLIKDNAINDPQLQVHVFDILATVYFREGQLKRAEALFRRALKMSSSSENAMIPEVADVLNNLAAIYAVSGNYPKAAASYARALEVAEKRFGHSHPNTTTVLNNLGLTYIRMRRYQDAESQFLRSLAILENNGLIASNMGLNALNGLGRIYMETNQPDRAETLLARAVEAGRTIHARSPEMAETLELYSTVLRSLSKRSEAENLHTEAARIRAEMVLTIRAGR